MLRLMADPFKLLLNDTVVRALGQHLRRVGGRAFDRSGFEAQALGGLETLEFKARAVQIAEALEAYLPADFDAAAGWLEQALGPAGEGDELGGFRCTEAGVAGWVIWPMSEFIARRGLAQPERALHALHAMTQRFSTEWAIRPFIVQHPELLWSTLARWAGDPSAHVRRLVSEGSRPRLPWGLQLKLLIADPSPTLPLLARLQDDPSAYVRRSVANHLNDIAKDHPGVVADWLDAHLPGAGAERQALLRHASRSLVKAGDVRVLRAWGRGDGLVGRATLAVFPARIRLGDAVALTAELTSSSRASQNLVVDYVVHHVKADGRTSPKVFKGWQLTLGAGETRVLTKRHAVRPITTRVYYPGLHRVALQVNGQVVAEGAFELQP